MPLPSSIKVWWQAKDRRSVAQPRTRADRRERATRACGALVAALLGVALAGVGFSRLRKLH